MSKYRLIYFDARGRAELARLLCAAAGRDFEDIRIPVPEDGKKSQQWQTIKERAPFGQIPLLEVDDELTIAQSHAIERFLAREFDNINGGSKPDANGVMAMVKLNQSGLSFVKLTGSVKYQDMFGNDAFEQADVDMSLEAVGDLLTALAEYHFIETDEAKKKKMKRLFLYDTGPTVLSFFEGKIATSNSGYIVGDTLTAADLCLLDLRSWVAQVFPDDHLLFFGPFENCNRNTRMVAQIPGVAAWLKKRPKTAF